MKKQRNAIMIADTRPALVGHLLLQLQRTNRDVFDIALIYYTEISQKDMEVLNSIMPCRFIEYAPPLSEELLKKERFRHFSVLMFARYEMFNLIDEYDSIVWTDTDVLIQDSLHDLIQVADKTGYAMLREDSENKTNINTDKVRTAFKKDIIGYNMGEFLLSSGLIVITKKLQQKQDYTKWCYDKTIELADDLNLPDQGVLNALVQHFKINVQPINGNKYCRFPYIGRNCEDARIIHAWGKNKFWNDWYLFQNFPQWLDVYNKWKTVGGEASMPEPKPDISVIIPVFKPKLELFKQCLDSLTEQQHTYYERYSNFEIIIIAEPINVEELQDFIKEYKDKRIKLIINKERIGIAASLNVGLKEAKGKYIARMDDDDIANKSRLFKQFDYLEKNPKVTLCTSNFNYFGDMNEMRISFQGEMSKAWSIFTCPFDHPTIMFRKDFFIKNDLFYDEERGAVEDWELWLRAFEKGMSVGCIDEVLFYHRWHNGSAGQSNRTVDMMRELVQKNFKELDVEIQDNDIQYIAPWSGKVTEDIYDRLQNYFDKAIENNYHIQKYDSYSLSRVFQLRLEEAKSGKLSKIVVPLNSNGTILKNQGQSYLSNSQEKANPIKNIIKNFLKPLYRPIRNRFEDKIINIEKTVWDINNSLNEYGQSINDKVENLSMQTNKSYLKMQQILAQNANYINKLEEMNNFLLEQFSVVDLKQMQIKGELLHTLSMESNNIQNNVINRILSDYESKNDKLHRHIDFTYRDIMIVLNKVKTYIKKKNIQLITNYPIAYESNDYIVPHGTIRDNTRYPRFIRKCEEILGADKDLSFLDLGCSGGGMVLEAALRGHFSMGLEGSDASLKEQRAEWRLLVDNLKTCDITRPFILREEHDLDNYRFDIITAWEVLEHIKKEDLPQLLNNIKMHLSGNGYFIASIANWDDIDPKTGINWHVTTKPYEWWEMIFKNNGFKIHTDKLEYIDLARGGYNPAHCYEEQYSDINTEKGFYICAGL